MKHTTGADEPGEPLPLSPAYPWRHNLLCLLPTAALLLALGLTFRSESGLKAFFYDFRMARPLLTQALEFITDHGVILLNIPYIVLLVRAWNRKSVSGKRFVISYILSLAVVLLVVQMIKGGVGRARPFLDVREFMPWSWDADYDSFPSGHTTEALSAAIPLADTLRRTHWSLLLGLAASLIPFTRMYLGMHFMTDVLGGLVMGSLCGMLCWRICEYLENRGETPTAD